MTDVLLFMQPGRDRRLVADTLSEDYQVETTTDAERLEQSFECCVLDVPEFNRVPERIRDCRDTAGPEFVPFVLLTDESPSGGSEEAWEYVDDIINLPIQKRGLRARIRNLVERHRTSAALAKREQTLEETVRDLKLKERAMNEAPVGITIDEIGDTETSLIYVNEKFKEMTGYDSEMLGENCRFLQGEETDVTTTAEIREAIDEQEPVSVDILNYRKNGQKFWNKIDINPVRNEDGTVTHFVGFQTEITDRKIRERRLEVLNRVLSHNMRNKMSIILGYIDIAKNKPDSNVATELTEIENASRNLLDIAGKVQEVEQSLTSDAADGTVDIGERLDHLVSVFTDRYPEAEIELSTPETASCEIDHPKVMSAVREAIENAIEHNDSSQPCVEIAVERRSDAWLDIEIVDNGPGIPQTQLEVLEQGETSLQHADRLGIWLMYWAVNKAGGEFSVSETDTGGTAVKISILAADS